MLKLLFIIIIIISKDGLASFTLIAHELREKHWTDSVFL